MVRHLSQLAPVALLVALLQPFDGVSLALTLGDKGSSLTAESASSVAESAGEHADPAISDIPASLFSMHVQSELFKGMPWPSVSFGSLRLWDTYSTWQDLNPSRGIFDWSQLDRWLDAAQEHGVDVIYTFGVTPTWASSNPSAKCDYASGGCYPPANMQDWDDFVRAIATHAAGRIKYWEMWNEANQREYWSGDIRSLVRMTQRAVAILKSVDRDAKVFTPSGVGGSRDTSRFLERFFEAGGGQYIDGVAFHGYVNSIPSIPEDVNSIVDAVQSVMAAHGQSDKPLWDTEVSWGPASHLSNVDDQTAFVARDYILQWSKGVQRSYWYAWDDYKYGTLWNVSEGVRKPGIAYREVYEWLVGAKLTAPCKVDADSRWTCRLSRPGRYEALVVWNPDGQTEYTPPARYVRMRNLAGKRIPVHGSVVIGKQPVLLETGPARG